jgi:hypothetical protein
VTITTIYAIQTPSQSTREAEVATILFGGLEGLPLGIPSYDLNTNSWFPILTMNPNREFMGLLLTMIKLPVSA